MGQCASEPRNSDTTQNDFNQSDDNVVKLSDYESDFETSEDEQTSMGSKSTRRSFKIFHDFLPLENSGLFGMMTF